MTWQLNPTRTQVEFSVKHMMFSTVRGRFSDVSAEAELDFADLSKSKVKASATAASVRTGADHRDEHLRSADSFDAKNHPELVLESTRVARRGDNVEVHARLTIRGVTKPVVLRGKVSGPAKDPRGQTRVGFSLEGEVLREDFGLSWNQAVEAGGLLVAKKVKLELKAEFVQK